MSGGVKEVSAEYQAVRQVDDCPAGYRRTEAGVVPEDWDVKPLSEFIATLEAGVSVNSVERSELSTHDKFILKTSCIFGGYFDPKEAKSILAKDLNRAKLNPRRNSILVSRMNTPALVGEVGFIDDDYSNLYLPDRLWQTKYKNNESVDGKWLSFILSFPHVAKRIKETATGTSNSMKNISKGSFLSVTVPAPDVKEQAAIANALSDVDALITSQEKLIAKKRAIKTAAMQQLLTGKKRLPPFDKTHTDYKQTELGEIPEDWGLRKLGEFLKYEQPTKYLVTDTEYSENGEVPVLTAGKTFILGYTHEEHGIFDSLPVIIFDDFTTDTKFVDFRFKAKSSAMKMLLPRTEDVSLHYIFSLIQMIDFPLGDHKRHWIGEYQHLDIAVPSSNEEQVAISKTLADMSKEIETLEQRLNKTQQLKQGMMQELLTGRTRLIKPEQGAA